MKLQENTLFANRYELVRMLGRGGFSEVWLAKDNWTKLNIAIKVYAPGQGMNQDGLQEFSRELAGVYDLNHSNLLKPQHVDSWEGMPYLILPFCSQGSCLKKIGKMTEDELWVMIRDVAAGLAYLHSKGVVHQDIKPDNILVDDEGRYLITDFGISTRARSTLRKSIIGGGVSAGTTAYMGPERFGKSPAPIKASDIWSTGAMFYEMLEGNPPFGEIGGGLQKNGADVPDLTANVSDTLRYVVELMLSKDPQLRPTAEVLAQWAAAPASVPVGAYVPNSGDTQSQVESGRATQRIGAQEPASDNQATQQIGAQEPASDGRATQRIGAQEPVSDGRATQRIGAQEPASDGRATQRIGVQQPVSDGNATQRVATPANESHTQAQQQIAYPTCHKKWSWAAFCFGPLWGVFNGVLWTLLCVVPYIGFAVNIIAGIIGNEHAWKACKDKYTPEQFDARQKKWNKVAFSLFVIFTSLVLLFILIAAMS